MLISLITVMLIGSGFGFIMLLLFYKPPASESSEGEFSLIRVFGLNLPGIHAPLGPRSTQTFSGAACYGP